jgi:hypothetical protein
MNVVIKQGKFYLTKKTNPLPYIILLDPKLKLLKKKEKREKKQKKRKKKKIEKKKQKKRKK